MRRQAGGSQRLEMATRGLGASQGARRLRKVAGSWAGRRCGGASGFQAGGGVVQKPAADTERLCTGVGAGGCRVPWQQRACTASCHSPSGQHPTAVPSTHPHRTRCLSGLFARLVRSRIASPPAARRPSFALHPVCHGTAALCGHVSRSLGPPRHVTVPPRT